MSSVSIAAILVMALFASVGMMQTDAYAQDNSNDNNSNTDLDVQVLRPSPDLTAQWWQWASSFPIDENPITDPIGEDWSKGDVSDDVFFLDGNFGGKTERECTVAEGQD
jgi:hypothetical protein